MLYFLCCILFIDCIGFGFARTLGSLDLCDHCTVSSRCLGLSLNSNYCWLVVFLFNKLRLGGLFNEGLVVWGLLILSLSFLFVSLLFLNILLFIFCPSFIFILLFIFCPSFIFILLFISCCSFIFILQFISCCFFIFILLFIVQTFLLLISLIFRLCFSLYKFAILRLGNLILRIKNYAVILLSIFLLFLHEAGLCLALVVCRLPITPPFARNIRLRLLIVLIPNLFVPWIIPVDKI